MAKEIQWSRFLAPDSNPALGEQMGLVVRLSIPIILAEISSTVMSYVDSAMVGSLGAAATASVGLVASSTWLFSGMGMCMVTGFSIQIAQLIGAGRLRQVQSVMRQAMMVSVGVGLFFAAIAAAVSGKLPIWLGGAPEVWGVLHPSPSSGVSSRSRLIPAAPAGTSSSTAAACPSCSSGRRGAVCSSAAGT